MVFKKTGPIEMKRNQLLLTNLKVVEHIHERLEFIFPLKQSPDMVEVLFENVKDGHI